MHYHKGNYQEAINYFKKAIEMSEKYHKYADPAMDFPNLGQTYMQLEDFSDAKEYLDKGLNVASVGKYALVTSCVINIMACFMKRKAINHLLKNTCKNHMRFSNP